tara:strand:- start:545 stop:823 length:279 start_codon:yes stop_codon:yes gene_type:complete
MNVVWSHTANLDNLENIDYLLNEWSLNVVLNYELKVIETEKLLISQPYIGLFDQELSLYKRLVIPQIYMLYEVIKDEIHVIRLWNNYQKPYW